MVWAVWGIQKLNKPQLGDVFFLVDSLIMGIFRVLIKIVFVSKKNVLEKNMQIGRDDIPSKAPGSYLLTGDLALAQ